MATRAHTPAAVLLLSREQRRRLEQLVEFAIGVLDAADGDSDIEEDDPAGDPLDQGELDKAAPDRWPEYGIDQSSGPIYDIDGTPIEAAMAWMHR